MVPCGAGITAKGFGHSTKVGSATSVQCHASVMTRLLVKVSSGGGVCVCVCARACVRAFLGAWMWAWVWA